MVTLMPWIIGAGVLIVFGVFCLIAAAVVVSIVRRMRSNSAAASAAPPVVAYAAPPVVVDPYGMSPHEFAIMQGLVRKARTAEAEKSTAETMKAALEYVGK